MKKFILLSFVLCSCGLPSYQIKGVCEAMEKFTPTDAPDIKCGAKLEITLLQGGKEDLFTRTSSAVNDLF